MLITALLLAGYMQTEALLNGPVPADVPTFKVTLGSGPDFYAGIRINGAWVMDHTHEIKATQVVEFVPDDPFYTGTLNRTMMRNAVVSYEIPAMRKKRLEELWTSHGYKFLSTRSGVRAVKEQDVEMAETAREMAASLQAKQSSSKTDQSSSADEMPPVNTENAFSPTVLWIARICIAVGTILLLALLVVYARKTIGA